MIARVLALLLILVAPAGAAGPPGEVKAEPYSEGLLWRVSRRGTPDSYVFGTIHSDDPRVLELPEPVLAALKRSRRFAAEINSEVLVDADRLEAESPRSGPRLDVLVGEPAFKTIAAKLEAQGLDRATIVQMKPWAAMLRIAGEGRQARITLDERLAGLARAQGLRPIGLEWAAEQVAAFDAVPVGSQVALLKHVAANKEALVEFDEPTIQAWLARNLKALAAVGDRIGTKYPEVAYDYWQLRKHIIFNRTVLMNHRLYLPMRSGGVFVAVGALHLHGKRGLLAMLARDGYSLQRVW